MNQVNNQNNRLMLLKKLSLFLIAGHLKINTGCFSLEGHAYI